MSQNGTAILSDVSSNGFDPVTDAQNNSVVTTIFGLSCDGKLTASTSVTKFVEPRSMFVEH